MKTLSPFMPSFAQLPSSLPIFPLPNVVLLPRGHLPLNIFEPRYLKMIAAALASNQLIGMIQPQEQSAPSALREVGCAGRIVRYEETADGRMEILITGLCRFKVTAELEATQGYRVVKPAWRDFANDYQPPTMPPSDTISLFKAALRSYFLEHKIDVEDEIIEKLELDDLVNSLISFLPLGADDRQILLEASTLPERLKSFTAILHSSEPSAQIRH